MALNYLDFDLSIEPIDLAAGRYRARVLASPVGEASAEFVLPFSAVEIENYILKISRPRQAVRGLNSAEGRAAQEFGRKLYDAIFQGAVRDCLRSSLSTVNQQANQGLRLRLRLSDAPTLAELPWEYLYDTSFRRFFAHSDVTPIVRYLDLPERIQPLAVRPPLKILVMIASPRDVGKLGVEGEWRKVQEALGDLVQHGLVTLIRLEKATLIALQRQLRREQHHIFHFIGHGSFDQQTQEGVLLLEDENGLTRLVAGGTLGALLHDHRSLRLAVLNACEAARTTQSSPFSGIAQTLVQQGIPAVIAMQFEITDRSAITFAYEFYNALADRYPVDAALAEARKAIFAAGNDVEWGTPVLYLRAQDGQIFDVAELHVEPSLSLPKMESVVVKATSSQSIFQKRSYLVGAALILLVLSSVGLGLYQHVFRQVGSSILTLMSTPPEMSMVLDATPSPRLTSTVPTAMTKVISMTIVTAKLGAMVTMTPAPTSTLISAPTLDEPYPGALKIIEGIPFVYVSTGKFLMGSTDAQIAAARQDCQRIEDCEPLTSRNEGPQQSLSLVGFWIMQTEVTNAQYRVFVDAHGYAQQSLWTNIGWQWRIDNNIMQPAYWKELRWNQDDYPVVGVSWYEAMAYAKWLAQKTGLVIRLPTEAEWEKAARGPDGLIYPWGNDEPTDKLLNYNDKFSNTNKVGNYQAGKSIYGALDMAGNVWEWTSTLHMEYPYQDGDGRENLESAACCRIVRGGSYYDKQPNVRAAVRNHYTPDARRHGVGLRLVWSPGS